MEFKPINLQEKLAKFSDHGSPKIELDADKGLLIGSEVVVVEDYLCDREYDRYGEKGVRVQHKRKLNGKYIDWWKTDLVESGWVYEKKLPDACGYWVMFDQRLLVFSYR